MSFSKIYLTAFMAFGLLSSVLADQEDLEELIDAAFEAVQMTKYETDRDDELSEREEKEIKRNTRRQIRRHADRDGDLDADSIHFVDSVRDAYDSSEYYEHVQTCKVCNPFVNRLLRSTGIDRVSRVERIACPAATHCFTRYGACAMGVVTVEHSMCYCPTVSGPVWGSSGCFP